MKNKLLDTEKIGNSILEYTKIYEGTDKYASVMLAIEFGYHLALKEMLE